MNHSASLCVTTLCTVHSRVDNITQITIQQIQLSILGGGLKNEVQGHIYFDKLHLRPEVVQTQLVSVR